MANALNELSNSKEKMISKNALKDFNKLYNLTDWTKNFVINTKNLNHK